ncbi:MAG: 2-hydroxyacid dehydrogenase [Fibrobacteria bacterium]|jgi:D-lactate dehydrogenase|nr:2-hydroxyacid dehydrogenase [Fibrobacteria bacterium]
MNVAFFSAKPYEKPFFEAAGAGAGHAFAFFEASLSGATAPLAAGHDAVCAFVNDRLDAPVLEALKAAGVRFIVLRSAGFNHVDLAAAERLGLPVARVPAYSPYAVAEHAVALILDLNRKIHRAHARVREGNFSLDGLMGFDLHGRTAGVIGTGAIGVCAARILAGFGMRLFASDPVENPEMRALGARYVPLDTLFAESDVITLHCPLTPQTRHLINAAALAKMKTGVMLVNTSRGAVIDTPAVIEGLKSGKIGYLGLDVYEEEGDLFFRDLSGQVLQDDVFARLTTFPNVLITGHQAFFTREAMQGIAETTLKNLADLEAKGNSENCVWTAAHHA